MSGFPMPPPGLKSSVLDRVKLFLPQIQKANAELELKIAREGTSSVQIDSGLGVDVGANAEDIEHSDEIDQENDESDGEPEELSANGHTQSSQNSQALLGGDFSGRAAGRSGAPAGVVLEFALGDFDGTPIALAEAAAAASAVIAAGDETETAEISLEADK